MGGSVTKHSNTLVIPKQLGIKSSESEEDRKIAVLHTGRFKWNLVIYFRFKMKGLQLSFIDHCDSTNRSVPHHTQQ